MQTFTYSFLFSSLVSADSPEKLQQICPTCPLLLSVDSPEAMTAARVTLVSYKRTSTMAAGLGVKKITRAAAQVSLDILLLTLMGGKKAAGLILLLDSASNIMFMGGNHT